MIKIAKQLATIALELDKQGLTKQADKITNIMQRLANFETEGSDDYFKNIVQEGVRLIANRYLKGDGDIQEFVQDKLVEHLNHKDPRALVGELSRFLGPKTKELLLNFKEIKTQGNVEVEQEQSLVKDIVENAIEDTKIALLIRITSQVRALEEGLDPLSSMMNDTPYLPERE